MAPSAMDEALPARGQWQASIRSMLRGVTGVAAALALLAGCATTAPSPPAATAGGAGAAAAAPGAMRSTPPAAARSGAVALVNPGFESPMPAHRSDPEGWFTFQHAGDKSYSFALDATDPHGGARSLRIDYIGPEPYGAVAQPFEVGAHAGKLARYTAWMRTRDVGGPGAGLTLLLLSKGAVVSQNFMDDKLVTGTTGWTRYTLTLPIPQGAGRIEVGAMLQGKGSLWLDDAVLEIVDP